MSPSLRRHLERCNACNCRPIFLEHCLVITNSLNTEGLCLESAVRHMVTQHKRASFSWPVICQHSVSHSTPHSAEDLLSMIAFGWNTYILTSKNELLSSTTSELMSWYITSSITTAYVRPTNQQIPGIEDHAGEMFILTYHMLVKCLEQHAA